jgi:hypothetical protein
MADYRARLSPKPGGIQEVLGSNDESNIMYPLYSTGGILFQYTPNISYSGVADYKELEFTHSNYKYNTFVRSYTQPITVEAIFTSQTVDEAKYTLAVITFLKSATKMYFGRSTPELSGTPPPVLHFSYLGKQFFDRVPVVIESYSTTFENTVSYIDIPDLETRIPTKIMISIILDTQYNTNDIINNFSLTDFKQGKFLGNRGTGGFI